MTTIRVREQTTSPLSIPLTGSNGVGLEAAGLTTLTASLRSLDTGLPIFTGRDVKPYLAGGVLTLELTPADLTMVTNRGLERRVLTLSATYGTGKQWHQELAIEVEGLVGVG